MAMPVLIKSDVFEAKTKLSIHSSFFLPTVEYLIVWPTSKIFAWFLQHMVMFSKDISINKPQLLNVEIQIIRFPRSKWFLSCVFRFPDGGEPSPRLVDLNLAGDPTDPTDPTDPPTVQRDGGFGVPESWKSVLILAVPFCTCVIVHLLVGRCTLGEESFRLLAVS